MCGSSVAEKNISAQQTAFFGNLQGAFSQEFAGQEAILGTLNQALSPIVNAGPDQQGFGPQELAAINTQITQGVGRNFAAASQQINNQLAARGGGNEALPTGASTQINEALAAQAASTASGEQLQATMANYAQGRQNFGNAVGALSGVAGIYNPTGMAGQATGAGQAAFGSAQQMWQQGNEWVGALSGAVGGAMSMVGSMYGGNLGAPKAAPTT